MKNKIIKLMQTIIDIPLNLFFTLFLNRKEKQYDDFLSIVCIAKNESRYLREWIEFYKVIGADRVYLFDNDSTDEMKSSVQDYIDSGFIVYNQIHGINMQRAAYNLAIKKYKNNTKYMAFLDCDEFLMPCNKADDLKEIIDNLFKSHKNTGGIGVNWQMYGSSGYEEDQHGTVLSTFLHRASSDKPGCNMIKTIANPRVIYKYRHPHYPIYAYGYHNYNECGEIIHGSINNNKSMNLLRINHYFTKSKEEWIKRRSIGRADMKNVKRPIEDFYMHDNNDIYDDIGLYYDKKIKEL